MNANCTLTYMNTLKFSLLCEISFVFFPLYLFLPSIFMCLKYNVGSVSSLNISEGKKENIFSQIVTVTIA